MSEPLDKNIGLEKPVRKRKKIIKEIRPKYILLLGLGLTIAGICLFLFKPNSFPLETGSIYAQATIIALFSGPIAILAGTLKIIFRKKKSI